MNFVLKVMIITLSSMIDVPKICIQAEQASGQTLVTPETLRKTFDSLRIPSVCHTIGLLLVSPVVTLAEAAEYPLEDFSHNPEHGDYHDYLHTAIYFYLIIYLLKYAIIRLNNYIITYLYIFVSQLVEPVLVLFDIGHDNGCRQRPQRNVSARIDANKLQFLLDFLW